MIGERMTETRGIVETGAVPGVVRLVPSQKRSRDRFEKILTSAEALLLEKGSDGFKMSDVVARSGVSFGSLYQYFPDKTAIIGTLAERCNETGRACVVTEADLLRQDGDLPGFLTRIADGFFQMYQDIPVMRAIWQATQADPVLQALDRQDHEQLAAILTEALIARGAGPDAATRAGLLIALVGAVVRHAIACDPSKARQVLDHFAQIVAHQHVKISDRGGR